MPNQEELFSLEDIEHIVDLAKQFVVGATYQCRKGCKIMKHTFKVGDKVQVLGFGKDHFSYPVVTLKLENNFKITGSHKLFTENFIFISK